MLRNGKVLYIAECLAPKTPKYDLIGYTEEQWSGSLANEQTAWARLLELKLLYEPVNNKNIKLVRPGPSTDLLFTEAPGELGNWLGWRIVRTYMRRYPNTTMQELIDFNDAQRFLEKAKYKPRNAE
jgi:hypothetical protein